MQNISLPVNIKSCKYTRPVISFIYPQIRLKNKKNERNINSKIIFLMNNVINEVKDPYSRTVIDGSYEIKTNERKVLSLSLTGFGDFKGAHPMTYIKSLNFDLETGENYPLSSLFLPDSNYIEVISNKIKRQITERDIPLINEFRAINPNQDYYIADTNLIIYFQLYEISPYYVGFPYFSIPIYELTGLFGQNSLLDRMNSFS